MVEVTVEMVEVTVEMVEVTVEIAVSFERVRFGRLV